MKKMNTTPVSGMQELLPEAQAIFNELKNKISETYQRHGYSAIETPVIERSEILLAKAGGETEKQIYKVIKTTETAEDSNQALRFDHTVPLARYVVEHENDLVFPFKVSQIGRNFRGERAQRGRFREFYQCDVDVVGRGTLPLFYDVDIIITLLDALKGFGLDTPLMARISNRKILSGLLLEYGLEDKEKEIFGVVDHAEKVSAEKTEEALREIGLDEERVGQIVQFMNICGTRAEVNEQLGSLGINNSMFKLGLAELSYVMTMLETVGLGEVIRADMKIVRGLDYYTGTVFEFNLPEYQQIGSICGGGRYDDLAGYFTEQKHPGVGGSIGLTRLFYVLAENNLLKSQNEKLIDVAVIPISDAELTFAMKLAQNLMAEKKKVTVVATDKKLGDKLTYAAKISKSGIVIGEREAKTGEYEIKEFR